MTQFTDQQQERLQDLLKEKKLWQVYSASLKIPFSKFNIGLALAAAIITTMFAWKASTPHALAEQVNTFASLALNLCIAQLGFLLAGFSFFASLGDKEMFCRMADKTHTASGLSWLKYNFLVFMRVFCEFLFLALFSLALMVALTKGFGIRETLPSLFTRWPDGKLPVAAMTTGLFIGCVVYVLMQLASFIYNIYHVVMTSIRWALQKDYQKKNEAAAQQEGATTPPSTESTSTPRLPQ